MCVIGCGDYLLEHRAVEAGSLAAHTFTLTQYTERLLAAGIAQVRMCEIGTHSPAILATRP